MGIDKWEKRSKYIKKNENAFLKKSIYKR